MSTGWVPLTAARIQDGFKNAANGTLEIVPTDNNDRPIEAIAGGDDGGPISHETFDPVPITNGALPSGTLIPNSTMTSPLNVSFRLTFRDASGVPFAVRRGVQTTASGIDLDTYAPVNTPLPLFQVGPPGINFRGPFAPNTYYGARDAVSYNGSSYYAPAAFTSGTTFDPAPWQVIAQGGSAVFSGLFPNALNAPGAVADFSLANDGTLVPNAGYTTSGFIPRGATPYIYSNEAWTGLIYYDDAHNMVAGPSGYAPLLPLPTAAWTCFRVCYPTSSAPTLVIRTDMGTPTWPRPADIVIDPSSTVLFDEKFNGTTLSSAWTPNDSSVWAVQNGLITPPTPSGVWLQLGNYYGTTQRTHLLQFTVITPGLIGLGALKAPAENGGGTQSIFAVTPTSMVIFAGNSWTGGSISPALSISLTEPLTQGHTYTFSVVMNEREFTVTLLDENTGDITTTTYGDNATDPSVGGTTPGGMMEDFPVLYLSEDARIIANRFMILCNRSRPELMMMGDSITWGSYINTNARWADLVGAQSDANFVVSARPGGTSTGLLARVTSELQFLRPKFVVFLIGANDCQLAVPTATFIANLQAAITAAVSFGSQVLIGYIIPFNNSTDQARIDAYNAQFSTLTGVTKFIRWDQSMSTGDGVTGNSAYYVADGVHPNAAGSVVMTNKLLADAPFVSLTAMYAALLAAV